jgi:RimJ/RimL family protein N-acetyltransferase
MRIQGKTVDLRLADVGDAEFILGLRLDERLGRHLSSTSADVESQREWLRQYKQREARREEYYFIVEDKGGVARGTLRLYDFRGDSFCWGSWIMSPGSPGKAALESALLAYQFGFETLGFAGSHFQVDKQNARVVAFHRRFGARVVDEDETNYYFRFSKADYLAARKKYQKLWNE